MTPYGRFIRGRREACGIDQQELAAGLEVSASYLSAVERGVKPPLAGSRREALARILSLNTHDLQELEQARKESKLRFELPASRLNPLQVRLANRLHASLAALTPAQISRIERELNSVQSVRPASSQ